MGRLRNVLGSAGRGGADEAEAEADDCTRYARPWRPVKPLEMTWEVRQRSVAHLPQWMCDVWPCRYLSVGASMGASVKGAGVGVGLRLKGLDEGVSVPERSVVEVEVVVEVELWRDLA